MASKKYSKSTSSKTSSNTFNENLSPLEEHGLLNSTRATGKVAFISSP